jgi:hypothetical protein
MIFQLGAHPPRTAPKRHEASCLRRSRSTTTSGLWPEGEYQLSSNEQSALGRREPRDPFSLTLASDV